MENLEQKEGATPEKKTAPKEFAVTVELPSGRTANIRDGKAKHAVNASRLINGDQSKFISAMISELVEIDGKKVTFEDACGNMPLRDYTTLTITLGEENFI